MKIKNYNTKIIKYFKNGETKTTYHNYGGAIYNKIHKAYKHNLKNHYSVDLLKFEIINNNLIKTGTITRSQVLFD